VTQVIQVLTLNDSPADFERLFSIWSKVNGYFEDVSFDFSHCRFLRPNAVAFLGGLAHLIEFRMGTVVFDWDSLHNEWVKNTLSQNGFAGAFGRSSSGWTGHSIPYREDRVWDANGIIDYSSFADKNSKQIGFW
jgi:hypothetical protein